MAEGLTIKNLTVSVGHGVNKKRLLRSVDLDISAEKIVGLVGGSGSGKTTTGLAVLRLLPIGLEIEGGVITFNGVNILNSSADDMQKIRGKEIGMIFQEPLNAFNPVFTVGYQIDEVLAVHTSLSGKQRRERILDLLNQCEIPEPQRIAESFPHQLSGGLRQRAMIAQSIAAEPKLIIADEPTSNLDVTVQAKIIDLFRKLREDLRLSILLITHDLGMVGHLADDVAVMSQGGIVEKGSVKEVLMKPQQEYTRRLMAAMQME